MRCKRTILYIVSFLFLLEIELKLIENIRNYFVHLDKKKYVIYCFGDSYTFGDGASPKDSYPRQLERMLNENSKIKFQVFNLGIPGSNSSQVLIYLKRVLARYAKPDLIIVRAGISDSWNFANCDLFLGSYMYVFRSMLNNLKIYELLEQIAMGCEENYDLMPSDRDIDNIIYKRMETSKFKEIAEHNLTKIVKFAQSKGIKVILQNYPGGDIYGSATIANVARRFLIPMVDNFGAFNKKLKTYKREDIFAPYWNYSHPNADGYGIMADEVRKTIKQNLKIDTQNFGMK